MNFHGIFFWWQWWDHWMVAAIFYNRISRKRLKERMYTISWTSVEGHINATKLSFSLFAPQSNKLCLLLYSCCLEGFWPLWACCVHTSHGPCTQETRDPAGGKKAQSWQKGRCFHRLSCPSSVFSLSPCTRGCPKWDWSCFLLSVQREARATKRTWRLKGNFSAEEAVISKKEVFETGQFLKDFSWQFA